MKRLIFFFILINWLQVIAQNDSSGFGLQAGYFYGNFIKHNNGIAHLITDHPEGFLIRYNVITYGDLYWQQAYNYPDWGFSFLYQNNKNEITGNNFSLLGHVNFYFLNRKVKLLIAQGIAFNTNPFDIETNIKNYAFGSSLLSTTQLGLFFSKENIFDKIGLQAGLLFIHFSNANVKAPNTSLNSITLQVGVNYKFENSSAIYKKSENGVNAFSKKISYQILLSGGINSSDYLNLGQQPFWTFSVSALKRINYKSSIVVGGELFFAKFLKKEIEYLAVAFPSIGLTGNEDYKRAGIFVGHNLHINRFDIITHLGYYVYYPYDFEGRFYQRIGFSFRISKKIFSITTLKTHFAKAEGVEFGIGYKL